MPECLVRVGHAFINPLGEAHHFFDIAEPAVVAEAGPAHIVVLFDLGERTPEDEFIAPEAAYARVSAADITSGRNQGQTRGGHRRGGDGINVGAELTLKT